MADVHGAQIVRRSPTLYYIKPGTHSHNVRRRLNLNPAESKFLRTIRLLLLLLGLGGVGYYAYATADTYIYQAYQNWAFDQQIGGRPAVTFADYLRERTPFGFLAGNAASQPAVTTTASPPALPSEMPPPAQGSLLGRIEIGRLNLSAMVREGVDAKTLSIAVGHVPSSALAGQPGNFAIAAHRDTLFRALKDIKRDDLVTFQSPSGSYTYQVLATKIVKPSDVSVLRPDGGGLIPASMISSDGQRPGKLLTMITCYPFYYVGSAPKRFIVEAKLISTNASNKLQTNEAKDVGPPAPEPPVSIKRSPPKRRFARRASLTEPRPARGSSYVGRSHSPPPSSTQAAAYRPPKKRGFWHKVFHVS